MFGAPQKIWEAFTLLGSSPTSDELVGVRVGKQWGFVNRDDGMTVAASFDSIGWFGQEGLAAAERRGKWGFIDRTGRFVIEPQFDYVYNFACGLAHVQKGRRNPKWGLIDTADDLFSPRRSTSFRNPATGHSSDRTGTRRDRPVTTPSRTTRT